MISDHDALHFALSELGMPWPADVAVGASLADSVRELVSRGIVPLATSEVILRMTRSFKRSVAMMPTFAPRQFAGDMLFFRAALDERTLVPGAEAWKAYVSGAIHVRNIASTHQSMLDAKYQKEIGSALSNWLKS